MNEIAKIAKDALSEVVANRKEAKNTWDGSPYERWGRVEIDTRGTAGELLVVKLLEAAGRQVVYNRDATDEEKHWDLMCNGLSYEVKTARIGTSGNSFQHENIFKTRRYDGLIFVDIAPDEIYISCWAKRNIPWSELHHRKDGSYYKWDTGLSSPKSVARGQRRKFCVLDKRVRSVADFMVEFQRVEQEIRQHVSNPATL